eukprot:gnl/TRDRNA2_/TRDRNA2_38111_c0_seq1.p1 gnl/TRDRNA2_/TRDRNA2_38111_c0~~gnl/TRDRNA2_/TRDRNA2_38111_c0_seq1.p1  ORF type:complete len:461 (-),score=67.33 gnl/TRDRNA2_/TRDRNA2_38111_c0_seq1:186-1511(-)
MWRHGEVTHEPAAFEQFPCPIGAFLDSRKVKPVIEPCEPKRTSWLPKLRGNAQQMPFVGDADSHECAMRASIDKCFPMRPLSSCSTSSTSSRLSMRSHSSSSLHRPDSASSTSTRCSRSSTRSCKLPPIEVEHRPVLPAEEPLDTMSRPESSASGPSSYCSSGLYCSRPCSIEARPAAKRFEFGKLKAADLEARQLAALKSLVKTMTAGTPLTELAQRLLQDVVYQQDTAVANIPEGLIVNAVEEVLQRGGAEELRACVGGQRHHVVRSLVVDVLHTVSNHCQLHICDMLGQVLWRSRSELKGSRHHATAEDMSWLDEITAPTDLTGSVAAQVDDIFAVLVSRDRAGDGDRMRLREFQKVVRLVKKTPTLWLRIKAIDAECIFEDFTSHREGYDTRVDVDRCEFKELLMQLADSMEIHPRTLFKAVGCHAEHLNASNPLQK